MARELKASRLESTSRAEPSRGSARLGSIFFRVASARNHL